MSTPNDLDFVTRFVCTGSEDGCYSILPKQEFRNKIPSLYASLNKEMGLEVIERLRTIFERKSFVTKDPLLFALAMIVRHLPVTEKHDEDPVRHRAYDLALNACESPVDLFTFVSFDKAVSDPARAGWGRGMKRVVRQWYESKTPLILASEVTKCKSGRGWTHRDLIRQSHIRPDKKSKSTSIVLSYLAQGKKILEDFSDCNEEIQGIVNYLKEVELLTATKQEDTNVIRSLIEKNKFIDRQIPSHLFEIKETFEGLLGHMELVNLFRNIPKMASLGMLEDIAPEASKVIDHGTPTVIFVAQRRYELNKSKKWVINQNVVKALHAAFNASLQCLPGMPKQTLLAIHIDSKITKRRVAGANFLTPLMPCALMAKYLIQSDKSVHVVYFHKTVSVLSLNPKMPMTGIIEKIVRHTKEPDNANFDLSEPLKWAALNKKCFDNILIMSYKKVVSSPEAFHNALKDYRTELSLPSTKLAFIGLSDNTTIGNKLDLHTLEICGFNESVPPLIYNFFSGNMDFS